MASTHDLHGLVTEIVREPWFRRREWFATYLAWVHGLVLMILVPIFVAWLEPKTILTISIGVISFAVGFIGTVASYRIGDVLRKRFVQEAIARGVERDRAEEEFENLYD